jgi:type VI secretion system VasD/TssJ family lipoprotein
MGRRRLIYAGRLALFSMICVLTLSACSLLGIGSKDGGKNYTLFFEASPKLNSCGGEFGNALVVRLYELSSDLGISIVSLGQLWDNEQAELGDELLVQQEIVLEPRLVREMRIHSSAEYLAVAGNFCQTHEKCWLWVRSRKNLKDKITLRFGETCIEPSP